MHIVVEEFDSFDVACLFIRGLIIDGWHCTIDFADNKFYVVLWLERKGGDEH